MRCQNMGVEKTLIYGSTIGMTGITVSFERVKLPNYITGKVGRDTQITHRENQAEGQK